MRPLDGNGKYVFNSRRIGQLLSKGTAAFCIPTGSLMRVPVARVRYCKYVGGFLLAFVLFWGFVLVFSHSFLFVLFLNVCVLAILIGVCQ